MSTAIEAATLLEREEEMKKDNELYYYRLHVKDFLASEDFLFLPLAAKGLLFHCLMSCWANGSVPAPAEVLARLIGTPANQVAESLPPLLGTFFSEKDGRLTCPMLEKEYLWVENKSKKGTEAANKRWENERKSPKGECKRNAKAKRAQCHSESDTESESQSESDSDSESEEESIDATAPATLPPHPPSHPIVRIVDDDVAAGLRFLIASGEELGLSAYEAQKFVQEGCFIHFPGSSSQRLESLKDAIEQMRRTADTATGIINPYGLLKEVFQDIVRKKDYNRRAQSPEFSFLLYPDSDYEKWLPALVRGEDDVGYYSALDKLQRLQPLLTESQLVELARRVCALPQETRNGISLSDILTRTCQDIWRGVEAKDTSKKKAEEYDNF